MEPLIVGTIAPDFCLMGTGGRRVSLEDYRGKQHLILVFYPGNNTPNCNRQLASLQEALEEFSQMGTAVVAINPAPLEEHEKYRQQLQFSFPLLSDPGGAVAQKYQAFNELERTNQRTVYIIDKQGIIRYAKQGMHWDPEFLEVLEELQ